MQSQNGPNETSESRALSRRRFVQYGAMLAVGGRTLFESRDARAAVHAAREAATAAAAAETAWPEMARRPLGRTGFSASRLFMGCGASLMLREKDALLNAALDAGINVFDVGYSGYYQYAEENLSGFIRKVRDQVFLISKAPADLEADDDHVVTPDEARRAAAVWSERLDASLAELKVDHVDAYYLMAAYNPSLVESDEIHEAFQKAKKAGKVSHLGVSTHRNAEKVMQAAARSGRFDLAMIAITPGGWYDWESRGVLEGSRPMTGIRPALEEAKASGLALVGMKAARHLSGLPLLGWFKKLDAFDAYYDEELMAKDFSSFQRSYAYVLANGLEFVNADIQNIDQLKENVVATASAPRALA